MSQAAPQLSAEVDDRPYDWQEWFTSQDQLSTWQRLNRLGVQIRQIFRDLSLNARTCEAIDELLTRAERHLEFRRPYVIAVVGVAGAGKSTLINALLGRDAMVFKYGRPTTGTIVTIKPLQPPRDGLPAHRERAYIYYRSRASIGDLTRSLSVGGDNASARAEQIAAIDDLTRTAQRHRALIDMADRGEPDVIELLGDADWQRVQELIDDASPTNSSAEQRILPIIERVELHIFAPAITGQSSVRIEITDVPGADARSFLHERHLREQIDPLRTDALLLVLPPERPEQGSLKLQGLVENMFRHLTDEQRAVAAGRLFLVVSKADVRTGVSRDEAERNIQDNVRVVAESLLPGFRTRYAGNIFVGVKALPALIAQLIQANPAQGATWLSGGASPRFERLALDLRHYQEVRAEAQDTTGIDDGEAAVLHFSRVPELRTGLAAFVGRSRWERELGSAQTMLLKAQKQIHVAVSTEWSALFGDCSPADTGTDPEAQVIGVYARTALAEVSAVQQAFRQAIARLATRNTSLELASLIADIVQNVAQHIRAHTEQAAFKELLAQYIVHPVRLTVYQSSGAPEPLVALDTRVLGWLAGQVDLIAERLAQALHEELRRGEIEQILAVICQDPALAGYRALRPEALVAEVRASFEAACRGALIYQTLHYDVLQAIVQSLPGLGQLQAADRANGAASPDVDRLIDTLRSQYGDAHQELIRQLPARLAPLFFFHVHEMHTRVEQRLEQLRSELAARVGDPESISHQRLRLAMPDLLERAQRLRRTWAQLQQLVQI